MSEQTSNTNIYIRLLIILLFTTLIICTSKSTFAAQPDSNTQATSETASTEITTEVTTETASTETTTEVVPTLSKPVVDGSYSKKGIKLTWKKVKNATNYYIYRQNIKEEFVKIGETEKTHFTDTTIAKNKYYIYKVIAVCTVGDTEIKSKPSKAYEIFSSPIDPKKKMVAITFDDGPGPYTKKIVDCLKENDARATFFVVGANISNYKKVLKSADKIGCEIGNHTWNHANLARLSSFEIKSQMRKTDRALKKAIGKSTTIMRTPYGSSGGAVKTSVGKPVILWSIDTLDWKTRNTDKTVSSVLNNVKDGDIVLMHDIHKPTMKAALIIIPRLKAQGYQLVTVSELAKYRDYKLKKGTTYSSLRAKN